MNLEKSFRIALATKGIKQTDLAVQMKVTAPYINQIARGGSMSVSKLQDVCSALGYKVWEFVKLGEE